MNKITRYYKLEAFNITMEIMFLSVVHVATVSTLSIFVTITYVKFG